MRVKRVAVIGAGWSGAAAARRLHDGGVAVEVFEATEVVGGHSRAERLNGVLYEPNGPHVFHTSHPGWPTSFTASASSGATHTGCSPP